MSFGLESFIRRSVFGCCSSQIRSLFSSSYFTSNIGNIRGIYIPKSKLKDLKQPYTQTCCTPPTPNYLSKGVVCWTHVPSSKTKIMTAVSENKPNVVFVLGGPGAGKGTQCSKIVEKYGFVHLSAGDLLREERIKPGSEYGELIEKHIRDGTIVPVEITCSLLERAMAESDSTYFLIDGFPRNQNNLEGWDRQMTAKVNVLFVLFFDAPDEVCVERCLSRGQAGSGRSDDNPESLKKRVFTYMNDTLPIINHFVGIDLVRKVDASKGPEEVFEEVKVLFDAIARK